MRPNVLLTCNDTGAIKIEDTNERSALSMQGATKKLALAKICALPWERGWGENPTHLV